MAATDAGLHVRQYGFEIGGNRSQDRRDLREREHRRPRRVKSAKCRNAIRAAPRVCQVALTYRPAFPDRGCSRGAGTYPHAARPVRRATRTAVYTPRAGRVLYSLAAGGACAPKVHCATLNGDSRLRREAADASAGRCRSGPLSARRRLISSGRRRIPALFALDAGPARVCVLPG
jgi:hypothetical protein